ncbi:MAG: hypothetical protein NDJ89_18830, partial [Oligoflexia bacterium]|nr:hypothetical protein [Oligoflexia bacterium]
WSVDCDKDGVILSASMANGPQPVPGADRELVIRDIDSTITFYPSGRISVIRLSGNYFDPLDPRVNKFHFQFPAGSVVAIGASYSEQGTIESVFASEETPLVTSNGKTVRCLPKRLISLTNEGYLRGCYGFTSDPVRLWNHDFVLESKEASWWTFDGAVLTTDYLSERPDFKVSLNGVWVAGRYLNQSDDKTWSGAYMDGFSLNIQGQVLTFIPFSTITSFWLNGGLAIGSLASAQSFTLQVGNRKVEFTSTVECGFFSRYRYVTSLSLHENGAVKEATLARDATFVSKDGRQVVVKKYSDVSFDPDGNFLKETPANCI